MSNFESKEVDPSQEKDLADSVVAREISQEIMRYGVIPLKNLNQQQNISVCCLPKMTG